ncbi:MAG: sulfatase-like hydrolase/transferase [Opitutaceae bacterium]|jgi:arylsulfatase A-like enzyme|nr:sulfatase-like hydrolase/transferase [Opitutaceae bacterium]
MQNLTRFLLTAAVVACTSLSVAAKRTDDRPNILFILLDDLGKEWVSSYGATDIETPVVDSLAAGGIKFNNFYVMPQCTPTRLTLMTGQKPFRHGWVNHWDVPRWGGRAHYDYILNPSMVRGINEAGYATAVAGKWQVNDFRVQPEAMVEMGFDDYCMWTGWEADNKPSAERYWDPYIHTKEGSRTYQGAFGDKVFTDFLIDFMGKHKDEPMLMYFAMCLPHGPLVSTPSEPDVTDKMDKHKAMVRYADELTGQLVQALDDLGIRDDTIIIWTTDNGTAGSITGTRNGRRVPGGKAKTLETGVNSPFIVNAPGRTPVGIESNALFTIADMMPTFAELAGAKLPEQFVLDGVSVADALLGKSERSPHDWIMAMGGRNEAKLTDAGVENAYVYRDRVLRNERFKLYVDTNRTPEKLFDLENDPWEEHNIIGSTDPDAAAAQAFLTLQLSRYPGRDSDPIYNPLPARPWDVPVTAQSEVWKK